MTLDVPAHACVLHGRVAGDSGQAAPPLAAGVVIVKVREMMPAPHGTLQADQADHVPVQSVWHTAVLHACDSVRVGQAAPPLLAGVVTRRDRDCVPPPQVAEQGPNALQSDTLQCTMAWPAAAAGGL